MNDYLKMMTGGGRKKKERPPIPAVKPCETKAIVPEIVGRTNEPLPPSRPASKSPFGNPPVQDIFQDVFGDMIPRMETQLNEAVRTGETIVEMREVVARSGGQIKARSVEVCLTFGRELNLGELLRGCLAIWDQRLSRQRVIAAPMPVPNPHYLPAPAPRTLPPPQKR